MGSLTAAADGSHMSGAMIALMPTAEDAERLAIEGGEAAEQLHLTLFYLGNGADWSQDARDELIDQVRNHAMEHGLSDGLVHGRAFGSNQWNANGDEPCWVWAVGDDRDAPYGTPNLEAARWAAVYALEDLHRQPELPAQHTPWQPHVCAAYSPETALLADMNERLGPVAFDRIRVVFAGDHTDIPLGDGMTAAAGPLRRQPTDLELASRCDFADMNDAWHQAVDTTVDQWEQIQTAQREQITAAVAAAVDANDLERLTTITVPTTDAANLLFGRMQAFALAAGQAQQREAEAQGVEVPEWSLDDEALVAAPIRDRLRQVATTTARLLGLGLVQSAVRRAVQLFGSGTGAEVAAQVDEHLESLSGAAVEEQIGAAMTAAQNEGRMAVLAVAPPATYTATEILEPGRTCQPCRDVDGTEYATLAEARAAYPSGGFINCLGGTRCRGTLVTLWPQGGEQEAAGMILAASGDTMPPTNREGGGTVPFDVVTDHPDCADNTPFAVVRRDTDELMGCHPTHDEAMAQLRTLLAEEGARPDDGTQRRGENEDDRLDYAGETAPWEGVLAVEGITTGDGREFAPDALTWADLPVPLRWNIEDSHGGDPHTVAVNVGRIDKIWRDGNTIMGAGVLDLGDDQGRRAYDKIKGGFLRGVSIDADSIADADVEMVWPEDVNEGVADEDDLFEMLFAQPEKMIFHAGRIRAATLVDIPAFAEAYVALLDDQGAIVAGGQPIGEAAVAEQFGAVGTHDTATSDGPWDGPANERRLPSPMSVATARDAYAWIDDDRVEDGELVKDAGRFIHHEVSADGTPGAANLTACSTGIGILNGGRGGTTIPRADFQGVYNHLAAHLRDADREPPPLTAGTDASSSQAFGSSLAGLLNQRIDEMADDDTPRSEIVSRMGSEAGIAPGTVNEILSGDINCPPEDRLAGFARALGVSASSLMNAAEDDGCTYGDEDESMTASLKREVWQPPVGWFADPKLSLPTPITITDDGRIYGHAAQWGSCHIGQEGACIKPPRETEHPYYRTGEVVCVDGSRVAVGQITVGTGHAPLHYGASPAAEHYDNTGAAVADVAVGNDRHGIWVAGAVRPGADPLKVYELQAAGQVSGDWRRIGGQLRLVGLLAVNVPGFPVPKMRARVASGQPQALVAAGRPTVAYGMSQIELERWATRVVMRMLSRQVHPGGG